MFAVGNCLEVLPVLDDCGQYSGGCTLRMCPDNAYTLALMSGWPPLSFLCFFQALYWVLLQGRSLLGFEMQHLHKKESGPFKSTSRNNTNPFNRKQATFYKKQTRTSKTSRTTPQATTINKDQQAHRIQNIHQQTRKQP